MGSLLALVSHFAGRQARAGVARLARWLVLAVLAALALAIAAIFGALALHEWLARSQGSLAASVIVAVVFGLAGLLLALGLRTGNGRRPSSALHGAGVGERPERLEEAALRAGRDMARSLDGKQLVLASLIAGFVAGRMLDAKTGGRKKEK